MNLKDQYSKRIVEQFERIKRQRSLGDPAQRFDLESAIRKGAREYQEDAIAVDRFGDTDVGVVVLSDGMGGHAAGDVASEIVVTHVLNQTKLASLGLHSSDVQVRDCLKAAAEHANTMVGQTSRLRAETTGMGATLLALVLIGSRGFYLSIGDSPLFRLRSGQLTQLNDDHSMAPQIDMMAKLGILSAEEARDHPDRNVITSVVMGNKIAKVDCPEDPLQLEVGDILIAATDGLQFLENKEIRDVVHSSRFRSAAVISKRLIKALEALDAPEQDNYALSVIKVIS